MNLSDKMDTDNDAAFSICGRHWSPLAALYCREGGSRLSARPHKIRRDESKKKKAKEKDPSTPQTDTNTHTHKKTQKKLV